MQAAEMVTFLRDQGYQCTLRGKMSMNIEGFCPVSEPKSHAVTWLKNADKLEKDVLDKLACCQEILIITKDEVISLGGYSLIIVDEPKAAFFEILNFFFPEPYLKGISEDSVIETAKIGQNVSIGHHCYIHPEMHISDGVIIEHNVSIVSSGFIGKNTIIHSGTVIGTDGFGYFQKDGSNRKVPHYGGVWIGENVEIGANTCIDRGTMNDTIICDNVKIDNLCHIAHNVYIGKNSLVTALTVLGGSCRIERNSYLGIGSAIRNQIEIGENTTVGMGAVVVKDVLNNKVVAGVPAKEMLGR